MHSNWIIKYDGSSKAKENIVDVLTVKLLKNGPLNFCLRRIAVTSSMRLQAKLSKKINRTQITFLLKPETLALHDNNRSCDFLHEVRTRKSCHRKENRAMPL